MSKVTRRDIIHPAEGFRNREAASFFAQLEDQSRRLAEAVRDLSTEELEWQPAPGMNTIGMLLAHNAIAETLWTQSALLGMGGFDIPAAIGVRMEDDGLPLDPGGAHPEVLRGKPLSHYLDLLARTRAYFREAAARLTDEDLDREITRRRDDGSQRVFNVRWALYHMLEHFAGHYGQILLLRHQYRAAVGSPR
jgi:uncharacterized damage-inducible protein DinB